MSFQLAAHVIDYVEISDSAKLIFDFLQRQAGKRGIYARQFKKIKTLYDSFRKHRSLAPAPTSVEMTYFPKPASSSSVRNNMLTKLTFQRNPEDGPVGKEIALRP